MLAQGNNLRLRDEGRSRGRSRTQDQKTRTVSTCWNNPAGISPILGRGQRMGDWISWICQFGAPLFSQNIPQTAFKTGVFWCPICQGQVSAEGILHPVNPNSGSNSGMRSFEPRILGPNSGVEFVGPMLSNKKSPLKNSPSRNSPPKIHIKECTPEFGLKNSHCTSAGPFC